MAIIETCLTILGAVSGAAGLHSWFTGFKAGEQMERVLQELRQTQGVVERLSEHILYTPSMQQVRDITKTRQDRLESGRYIRELLEPMQQGLGEDILSTAVLSTPRKLREAFGRDPWEVLFEIRPVDRARRPTNPDTVPILFLDDNKPYIGWQMKGTLPILFDCEYDSEQLVTVPHNIVQEEVATSSEEQRLRQGAAVKQRRAATERLKRKEAETVGRLAKDEQQRREQAEAEQRNSDEERRKREEAEVAQRHTQNKQQQTLFSYVSCPECNEENPRNNWHCTRCGQSLHTPIRRYKTGQAEVPRHRAEDKQPQTFVFHLP